MLADHPLTTAGAAFAQTDLMLHLLRRRLSPAIADAVGKALLLDRRQLQSPFVIPAVLVQGNALISRLIAEIEKSLPELASVKTLAANVGMSERTWRAMCTRQRGTPPGSSFSGCSCTRPERCSSPANIPSRRSRRWSATVTRRLSGA